MQLVMETVSTQIKPCDDATLSNTNPTWAHIELNLGLRGERQATDRQNNGRSVYCKNTLKISEFTHTHTHTHIHTYIHTYTHTHTRTHTHIHTHTHTHTYIHTHTHIHTHIHTHTHTVSPGQVVLRKNV